jgi:hypothetical protein
MPNVEFMPSRECPRLFLLVTHWPRVPGRCAGLFLSDVLHSHATLLNALGQERHHDRQEQEEGDAAWRRRSHKSALRNTPPAHCANAAIAASRRKRLPHLRDVFSPGLDEAAWSQKYGRTAPDALSKPRCGMSCPNEPQLEQGEGHEQDGDTGDIAPAQYQRLGRRGRREMGRHLRGLLGKSRRRWET